MEEDYSYFDEDVGDDSVNEDFVDENPEIEDENIEENEEEEDPSQQYKYRETKYDIVPYTKTYENYYTTKKTLKPFLTKFERAKILGVRAEMIASGAPVCISVPKGMTEAYEIAKLEFKEKKIPLLIRRYLPNGAIEDWRLEDMIIN